MPTVQVSQLVLSMFDVDQEYGPFELLERLKENHLEEAEVKEALAYLISEHQLELTQDLMLKRGDAHVHG